MSQMFNYFFLKYLKKQIFPHFSSLLHPFFNPLYTENAPFIKEESGNKHPVFASEIGLKQGISFFLLCYFPKSSNMP
jgi:hypothetical protein